MIYHCVVSFHSEYGPDLLLSEYCGSNFPITFWTHKSCMSNLLKDNTKWPIWKPQAKLTGEELTLPNESGEVWKEETVYTHGLYQLKGIRDPWRIR